MTLPVDAVLPELAEALERHGCAVLVAEPGAGKTTRVPPALLGEPWLAGRRIVMLEPRRLAARAAARYMAAALGETVGQTVGYRMRSETRVGPATRLEVVTEGVLTRLLQSDPALEGVGLIIFDEFHERSLHADLGLALCLQARELLRPDLRLLVMSATLEAEPVAELMGEAPVVRCAGRTYPVETHYLARPAQAPVDGAVARTVARALEETDGDILVFLPGAAEIRRVAERLDELGRRDVLVAPLHGDLPREDQDRALAPSPPGMRKVVLSTAIAETSLTVEGVRAVVDSGLTRVARFSPRTGMTRLETVPVSRAAADQRRGRAGRLGPGVCYRLWTCEEHERLPAYTKPEILEADLAPLALELARWGVAEPEELRWLDPPPRAALARARELLAALGALDGAGRITPLGRRMAELPVHPRLAHMLLGAAPLGLAREACELAALLSERDLLRRGVNGEAPDADLRLRVEVLRHARPPAAEAGGESANAGGRFPEAAGDGSHPAVDRPALRRARAQADDLLRRLREVAPVAPGSGRVAARTSDPTGLLVAFAFPDRIAARRSRGSFLLVNGRGARFAGPQSLENAPFLAVAELDDAGPDARILSAAPIDAATIEAHFGDRLQREERVEWDPAARAVRAVRRTRLGALVISEGPLPAPDPQAVTEALLAGVAQAGIDALPWTPQSRRLQQRLIFLRRLDPAWPDVSDAGLLARLPEWLRPYLEGAAGLEDLKSLDLREVLLGMLSPEQRRRLDEEAPTHLAVPSGSRIPIDYSDPDAPFVAVRLQEVFGLAETPRVAGGRVPITMHLLSPAQRPVQVTRDLASFWAKGYFEVRKELRGRYPKHFWPDDPTTAPATNRTRPRT